MSEARAVVAGVLCAVLVILVVNVNESTQPAENAVAGVLVFAGIIVLLVGVDVVKAYHDLTGRSKSADQDEEPD